MTRVYLVRHGSHGLLGKMLCGRMEGVSLSDEGQAQAIGLARYFGAGRGIGAILSSPMQRCRQTAAPMAERLGLPVEIREDLNELDCGHWSGRTFDDLGADARWHAWNRDREVAGVPGGETVAEVRGRIMPLLERAVAGASAPAVWVTHGDIIKVAVLSLLGASADGHDRLEVEPASVTTLDLWPGGGKIVRSNEVAA